MRNNGFFGNYFLLNIILRGESRQAFIKTAVFFGAVFVFIFILNYIDGSLIIGGNNAAGIGLIQDYANYLYFLSFFLSTYLFRNLIIKFVGSFWGGDNVCEVLTQKASDFLNSVRLQDGYKNEYQDYLLKYTQIILLQNAKYRRLYYVLQTIILIVFLGTSLYIPLFTNQVNGNWNFSFSIYPLGFISNQIKDFIFYVIIIPPLAWGVTSTAIATTKICKKLDNDGRFNIRPLSPDKAGGLRQLGGLTLLLFYIVIIQFSHLFATSLIIGFPATHQIIYPLYFIFTAFVFFYPIKSVRRSLKEAKSIELERLLRLFDYAYQEFKLKSSIDPPNYSKSNLGELLELKALYKQVEDMPIWPFDVDTLIKFSSIFIIPLFVFFIQLLVNADSIIYNLDKLKIFDTIK
ncbi:MAG: hypothetical protein HUU54_05620 [Ignavibacteriaceae bacterium]|nr:hypothetical protein [Ignavibacteriaceae bacterium]